MSDYNRIIDRISEEKYDMRLFKYRITLKLFRIGKCRNVNQCLDFYQSVSNEWGISRDYETSVLNEKFESKKFDKYHTLYMKIFFSIGNLFGYFLVLHTSYEYKIFFNVTT